ncbi:MAG TPA: alpha/beta hydrolase-fold protein, partial [Spirochaetota bacterium]|nr:alpha/beta hydrolase-fold protein [Spirochaetota bacterium]
MIKDILKKVKNLKPTERSLFVNAEFEKIKSQHKIPVINENKVLFFYKGFGNKIQITGDFTSWVSRIDFKKIQDTDLYYLEMNFPLDARLDYKIIVDDQSILDPLNDNRVSGGFGDNSFFSLKNYKLNAYSIYDESAPKGRFVSHSFYSNFLKEERSFKVYLPPNYNSDRKYKTVYFQDGNEYIYLAQAGVTFDNLIHNKLIDDTVAVFVEPNIRHLDYLFNPDYTDFFVKEVINFTENSYSVSRNMEDRFIAGDSLGGLISAYIIYRYPGYFNG